MLEMRRELLHRRRVALSVVVALVVAGCGGARPAPSGIPSVRLVRIATLEHPLALAVRANDPALYVAEQAGRVVAIRDGTVDPDPVLDLIGQLLVGGEQGLLGLTFSPDGRFLYVDFTDVRGDTHVTEYAMRGGRADLASRRDVLVVPQPFANHNGGEVTFGPDGDLYVGLGDGGSEGDPQDNGQSLATLLGKVLRISPRPSDGRPYSIPSDNPFVGTVGARPEIWDYGLRNPWRFSFDARTGDLWIGDVGQNAWEEVDLEPAGSPGGVNYGWNRMEGSHPYDGGTPPPNAVAPVYEYSHDDGRCVVTGGYVYRGSAIPSLGGAYVFADFCAGRLEAIRVHDGRVTTHAYLGPTVPELASFGEDADGELYALSLAGDVYRLAPA